MLGYGLSFQFGQCSYLVQPSQANAVSINETRAFYWTLICIIFQGSY